MSTQTPPDSSFGHEVRVKVPLPIVIPLASIVLIGLLAYGFSQILLNVPKEAATMLAIVMAANVLIACTFIALRKPTDRSVYGELLVVALYPVIVGVAIAQFGFGEEAAEGAHGEHAAAPAGPVTEATLSASSVSFDTDTLTLAAGEDVTVTLDNQDSVPHNLAIYPDDGATDAIFQGANVNGGSTVDYEFAAPEPGEYYFQCDVHPSMNGSVITE
jgi:plastocyanin